MASDEERPTGPLLAASISRRQALGALAAGAGAAGLGLTLGAPGAIAQARTREFHGAWPYYMPPNGHFNTFVLDGSALAFGIYQELMELPLAMYYWHDQKWLWLLATGAHFEGQNFVVNLRKGVRWSDGSKFTAQDVLDTWAIWRLLGDPATAASPLNNSFLGNSLFDYVDAIHAPNDHQVVFHMKIPSTTVERTVLHQAGGYGSVSAPRASSVYGSFATRFRELLDRGHSPDSSEVKTLQAQFGQFRPTTMVVNGPFQLDPGSIAQDQLTLQRNPSSWANHLVRFDRIILYNGETPAITPVVLAGLVDYATHGFAAAPERAFIKKGLRVINTPLYYGLGMLPNYTKVPALRNKVARQALMYLIDRTKMGRAVEVVAAGKVANKYVTGFGDHLVPQWLDRATTARLNTYAHNPQRGLSMLRSSGWTRGADGIWVTPDGQKATWKVLAEVEYPDVLACATNFADQLAAYGFKLRVQAVTYTKAQSMRWAGNFELTATIWGAGDPHPYSSYVQDVEFTLPPRSAGSGSGFNPIQQSSGFGTVDVRKLIDQSGLGLNTAKQKALVQELALIYNELIPFFPFVERYGRNPTRPGVRVAGWPPLHDPIYLNSPYADSFVIMMLLTGRLHGV